MPAIIPLADFAPDQPPFATTAATVCTNVVPRTKSSYGPLSSIAAYSDAIGSNRCQGYIGCRDTSGNVNAFAGDVSKLYRLEAGTLAWSNVSKSATTYATASDGQWNFVQYGNRVIATNGADHVQSFVIGTSTLFDNLNTSAPKGRFAAIWNNHLVLASTIANPGRVHISAVGDPTSWPTPASSSAYAVLSGFTDLEGRGVITGLVPDLGGVMAVFFERSVMRATYTGDPVNPVTYEAVEGARGCSMPNALVQIGGAVLYPGEDGFYLFDGVQSQPIGNERVDRFFLDDVDAGQLHRVCGAADPVRKLAFWAYPGAGNTSGAPNKLLIFNWDVGKWSTGEINCTWLAKHLAFGYTLDTLDTVSASIDALPFSLDSRIWTGGRLLLSVFTTDHKLGAFSGTNLQATVETGDITGADQFRIFVNGARPYVEGISVNPTVTLGYRDSLRVVPTWGTATALSADEFARFTRSTRYARFRTIIPAGDNWTHIQGVEPDYTVEGAR